LCCSQGHQLQVKLLPKKIRAVSSEDKALPVATKSGTPTPTKSPSRKIFGFGSLKTNNNINLQKLTKLSQKIDNHPFSSALCAEQ
jgi:hypothetical protein